MRPCAEKTTEMAVISLLVVLAAISSAPAWAIDYSASGFLSLSAGKINHDDVEFLDLNSTLSFDNDTIIGGQLSVQFSDRFSVTGQVIARGFALDRSNNYQPTLDWLYLTYDMSPELRLRIGRLATPYYSVSEYFEIGAAYPWVRPPLDVYEPAMSPIKNFNGLDLVFRSNWKDWFFLSQFFAGLEKNETDIYDINIHHITGVSFNATKNYFSIRLATLIASVSLDIFDARSTLSLLRGLNSPSESQTQAVSKVIEILESNRIKHQYSSIGINWDNETWFVFSEYNRLSSGEGFTPDGEGIYVTLGYRLKKWTYYFTRGDIKSLLGQELKDFAVGELIPSDEAVVSIIGGQALSIASNNRRYQRTYALGLRYDISNSMALKFEAQAVTPERQSVGLITLKDEAVYQAPKIKVYSLVLDWVF